MAHGTAYIDMEFAGVYGTRQGIQIPIEIGVVIHEPETDVLSFAGKAFKRPVDVELWKNVTDDVGKRMEGQRRVFNLASPGHSKIFDKRFHLDSAGQKEAHQMIARVYQDLRQFMHALNRRDIGTLVFFARRREMETFHHSRVRTDDFILRDLQDEIRSCFQLKEHISLDRASIITDFRIKSSGISSSHFSYTIPEKFRYLVKPHKAIGDAARMFLVDLEFSRFPEIFRKQLAIHLAEYERRKVAEKPAPDVGFGQI